MSIGINYTTCKSNLCNSHVVIQLKLFLKLLTTRLRQLITVTIYGGKKLDIMTLALSCQLLFRMSDHVQAVTHDLLVRELCKVTEWESILGWMRVKSQRLSVIIRAMLADRNLFNFVTFNVLLLICHALSHRPRKMSTDEFGKSWGTLSYERKVKLTTPTVKQPAQFMKMMETGLTSILYKLSVKEKTDLTVTCISSSAL